MQNQRVVVGRFGSPYGVKGWIKLHSYTDPIENILEYLPWYVVSANREICVKQITGKLHGKLLIVHFESCQSPEDARTFTNLEVAVDRSQLPALPDEEYYWVDLISLNVLTLEGTPLGVVTSLFATGSNDVLVVKDADGKERYIPYIDDVVQKIDLTTKTMLVDWDPDF